MKRFLIALQFLTILPIKIKSNIKEKDYGGSLLYFPAAGTLIGILLSLTAYGVEFLPNLAKGAIILIASIIITGGIHIDGFADTCDGFYAGNTKEKILKIMRDSHMGAMGAIGITALLILKFSLITSIPPYFLCKALIMTAVFSRWSQAFACSLSPYARENGKAKFFIEYSNLKNTAAGALFTLALFIFLAKLKGIIIFSFSLIFALFFIRYVKRKLGGMTGDTIGAVNEIADISILFFALIFL